MVQDVIGERLALLRIIPDFAEAGLSPVLLPLLKEWSLSQI